MSVGRLPGWGLSVRAGVGRRRPSASDAKKRPCPCGVVVALGVCVACLSGCRIDAKVEFNTDSHPSVSFS